MRIERNGNAKTLVVTGASGDTTGFVGVKTGNMQVFQFENPAHDFPQIIKYTVTDNRLDAVISKADGKQAVQFPKKACDKASL